MNLTALVESADHVCCRYRLAAFRPFLAAAGHRLECRPLPRSVWDWFTLARDLRSADAVVLQRKLLAPWPLYLLRRSARLLFFDFDDAVFLRDSYAAKGLRSVSRLRRFRAVVRAADGIVAGNAYLAERAARWTRPERVRVVPTCVDPARYPPAGHDRPAGKARLVWIGSASTLQGLERVRPLLEHLGRRCPGVSLKLICDRSLELHSLPVIHCSWSEAAEAGELTASDIGLSWIPDDGWSRGKCGLKVLQYMAAGLPVVANPVGVQAEMVRHGETGFLAKSADEWAEAVGWLASDPDLRRRMGHAGRRRAEADYGVMVGVGRWLDLLERWGRRRRSA